LSIPLSPSEMAQPAVRRKKNSPGAWNLSDIVLGWMPNI
jgi:hypothetical protein